MPFRRGGFYHKYGDDERKKRDKEQEEMLEQELENYSRQLNTLISEAKIECDYHYETVAAIERTNYEWERACMLARYSYYMDALGMFTTAAAAIGTAISYYKRKKAEEEEEQRRQKEYEEERRYQEEEEDDDY